MQASERKMNWALRLYNQWRVFRIEAINCDEAIILTDLHYLTKIIERNFIFSMTRFITEIQKLNGQEYLLCTIYQMMICVQMYLEMHKVYWHILNKNHAEFVNLYYIIDNLIKEHSKQGLGYIKSSNVISQEAEEKMWKTGILGKLQPKQLCKTVLYLLDLHLALHGGNEHKHLRCPGFNP